MDEKKISTFSIDHILGTKVGRSFPAGHSFPGGADSSCVGDVGLGLPPVYFQGVPCGFNGSWNYVIPMPRALTAFNMTPVTGASQGQIGYPGCYLGYRPFSYHHHDLNPNKAVGQPMGFTYETDSQVHRYPGQPASQRPRCRMRTVFTDSQTKDLEQLFEITDYPGVDARAELAINSGLTEETVRVWFKNRRARRKRQRNGNKVKNSPKGSRREIRDGSPNCRSHQETAFSAFL